MGNVQVRLPDDLQEDIDALAKEISATRSEAVRAALQEGVTSLRLDRALARYGTGEYSLERGARVARVSLHRFARLAADRGVPYFRHGLDEAEDDLQTLRRQAQD